MEGSSLPQLEKLNWQPGQAAKQAAFLCYSSGTSGPPKGVMVTHRNVIAHVLQMKEFEARVRNSLKAPGSRSDYKDVVLGLLPQSHVYSLAVICHAGPYRGDKVVVLPKFEFTQYLNAIEKYRILTLYVVRFISLSLKGASVLVANYYSTQIAKLSSPGSSDHYPHVAK